MNSSCKSPEHIRGEITIERVDTTAGRLGHQAVVPAVREVAAVDVKGGLEEDRAGGLEVGGGGPEPEQGVSTAVYGRQ